MLKSISNASICLACLRPHFTRLKAHLLQSFLMGALSFLHSNSQKIHLRVIHDCSIAVFTQGNLNSMYPFTRYSLHLQPHTMSLEKQGTADAVSQKNAQSARIVGLAAFLENLDRWHFGLKPLRQWVWFHSCSNGSCLLCWSLEMVADDHDLSSAPLVLNSYQEMGSKYGVPLYNKSHGSATGTDGEKSWSNNWCPIDFFRMILHLTQNLSSFVVFFSILASREEVIWALLGRSMNIKSWMIKRKKSRPAVLWGSN